MFSSRRLLPGSRRNAKKIRGGFGRTCTSESKGRGACPFAHLGERAGCNSSPMSPSEADSRPESFRGASPRFSGLFFAILRRRVGFQRSKKTTRNAGYFIHRRQKRRFVRLRWLIEPADFP